MIKCFITTFRATDKPVPETRLKKIASNYWKKDFRYDFVYWFPFFELLNYAIDNDVIYLVYLIKCFRLAKGFRQFNVSVIM